MVLVKARVAKRKLVTRRVSKDTLNSLAHAAGYPKTNSREWLRIFLGLAAKP